MKKRIRRILAHYPKLWHYGLASRRYLNRMLRRPFDPYFRILAHYTPPPNRIYVDVGANVGEAIEAILLYQPNAEIVALEPNPGAYRTLSRTVGTRDSITLMNVAASNQRGSFCLYTPELKGREFSTLASLNREQAVNWLSRFAGVSDLSSISVNEYTVETLTIDSLGLSPSFLKVDVQGLEKKVLEGAEMTIMLNEPMILVERSADDDIVELLSRFGYRPFNFDGRKLQIKNVGSNTVFLTERGLHNVSKSARP